MRRRVHSAVWGLPAPQAEVLSLALIEGFDTEEIAATLACAPAVVERILDEAALTIVGRSTRGALSAAQPD